MPDGIPADVFTEKAANDAVQFAGEVVEFVDGLLAAQSDEQASDT